MDPWMVTRGPASFLLALPPPGKMLKIDAHAVYGVVFGLAYPRLRRNQGGL